VVPLVTSLFERTDNLTYMTGAQCSRLGPLFLTFELCSLVPPPSPLRTMSINAEGAPAAIAAFIRNFYRLSDDSSAHQEYVDSFDFSSGVFFQIGPMVPAATSTDILNWRQKAWEAVSTRKHSVYDVYAKVQGDRGTEFMLHGRVDYVKKDGTKSGATWAGRMVFEPTSIQTGHPKMSHYRVWLVSVPTYDRDHSKVKHAETNPAADTRRMSHERGMYADQNAKFIVKRAVCTYPLDTERLLAKLETEKGNGLDSSMVHGSRAVRVLFVALDGPAMCHARVVAEPGKDTVLGNLFTHQLGGFLLLFRELRVRLTGHEETWLFDLLKVACFNDTGVCKCNGVYLAFACCFAGEVQAARGAPAVADGSDLLDAWVGLSDLLDRLRDSGPGSIARVEL
jgi:hypothetical protein